jgi:hypothetical protein
MHTTTQKILIQALHRKAKEKKDGFFFLLWVKPFKKVRACLGFYSINAT